jgi:hypothetical protein
MERAPGFSGIYKNYCHTGNQTPVVHPVFIRYTNWAIPNFEVDPVPKQYIMKPYRTLKLHTIQTSIIDSDEWSDSRPNLIIHGSRLI